MLQTVLVKYDYQLKIVPTSYGFSFKLCFIVTVVSGKINMWSKNLNEIFLKSGDMIILSFVVKAERTILIDFPCNHK